MPNTPFKIIYEDEGLLVVNKFSGLIVNRSYTAKESTLQDYLFDYLNLTADNNALPDTPEYDFNNRAGIVHRLDKDTSGVLLVAKTLDMFTYLQYKFKERLVKKEYIAVVFNKFEYDKVSINAPIIRNPRSRYRFMVSKAGKEANTTFEKLHEGVYSDRFISTVCCFPKTGRTHQIRVHLCALNNPIVGDPIYSSKKNQKWVLDELNITRMLLHAYKISFTHSNGKEMVFKATIPSEFDTFMTSSTN